MSSAPLRAPRGLLAPVVAVVVAVVLAALTGCEALPLVVVEDARVGADPDAQLLDSGLAADARAADAGPPPDAEATPDAEAADALAAPDAEATPDAGAEPPCDFSRPADVDALRVVLVAHPFTARPEVRGTSISTLTLDAAGTLAVVGTRLDVGFRVARMEIVPSGRYALVVGEDGDVAVVRIDGPSQLVVTGRATLPRAGYGDIRMLASGRAALVVGSNVDQTSGVSHVKLGCDGTVSVDVAAFHPLRLTASIAPLGSESRWILLGGQAVFAPVDTRELRILTRANDRLTEVAALDVWSDAVDALRIATSPDGRVIIIPNGSPFSSEGGRVMIGELDGDRLPSPRFLMNADDAREAAFSPDGQTALVTLLSPGRVVVLADRGRGFEEVARVAGIGLAEQMAVVRSGALAGRVLLPSVDPNGGPNVAQLQITGPGAVRDLGQVELGPGSEVIPGAIAARP
jgi:hypothetical protein